MRLTLTDGERKVEIVIDGREPGDLAAAEQSALRMLAALGPVPVPASVPPADDVPFGYSVTAETERAQLVPVFDQDEGDDDHARARP